MKLFVQCVAGKDQRLGRFSYGLDKGWWHVYRQHIEPITKAYMARYEKPMQVILHNPWGNFFKHMHCDSYRVANNAGATFFTEEFETVCKQLTADGSKPIAYVGSPHNTKSLLDMVADPSQVDHIHAAVMSCIAPAIDAGCQIAWDNFSSTWRIGLEESIFRTLEVLGVKQYIEATLEIQSRNRAFWNEDQIITNELFWSRHNVPSRSERFPQLVDGEDRWYQSTVSIIVRKPKTAESFWNVVNRIESLNALNGGHFLTKFEPAISIALGKRYL